MLLGLVAAHILLDLAARRTQLLLLSILAHLADHGLALLGVGVLLGLLGAGADLQLTLLHGLVVAVLLLHGEGHLVGELLAPLLSTGLAQLLAHLIKKKKDYKLGINLKYSPFKILTLLFKNYLNLLIKI